MAGAGATRRCRRTVPCRGSCARADAPGMSRAAKWLVALLLGAIAPAALVAFARGSAGIFAPAAAITLGHAVILGMPVALLYRRLRWRSPAFALAGGFVIGALPSGLYFWPVDPRRGTSAWSGTTQTLVDGVPTWAGWVEYLQ